MTSRTLIRRSLRYHARAHLGIVLGAAIGSAALIGALIVGDSVRHSLREQALARLGSVHFALSSGDRFFLDDLALRSRSISFASPEQPAFLAGLERRSVGLVLEGTATTEDGAARVNRVNLFGVDAHAWPALMQWGGELPRGQLVATYTAPGKLSRGALQEWQSGETVLLNETLSRQLRVKEGDEVIFRIRKPSALAQDAVISPRDESAVALRIKAGPILPDHLFGNFSLVASPLPPANAFLASGRLGRAVELEVWGNLLVSGPIPADKKQPGWWFKQRRTINGWLYKWPWWRNRQLSRPGAPLDFATLPTDKALASLTQSLKAGWLPEDGQLSVKTIQRAETATGGEYIGSFIEISSSRIFLEPIVVAAAFSRSTPVASRGDAARANYHFAQSLVTNGVGVLTYLANLIRAGDRSTPYSMVSALDPAMLPEGMRNDEIVINDWLADDLQVKAGDRLDLAYYVVDSGSQLTERTNSFRVHAVMPMRGIYADRTLMPEFPGVARAESTHDWDTGFPLEHEIRDKDETYWKQYRGTPKAFITLAAGQNMWSNRFGSLTAIRYPVPTNTFDSVCREAIYQHLRANLTPEAVGLRFEPVREQALKGADQAQDFGQLFLGFSIFLIVAALLLMSLLFQLALEQRAAEIGTLLSLGFRPRQVRRLLLVEGTALALIGGVLGALGGVAYAKAMLWGLSTIWQKAIGNSSLTLHIGALSLLIGLLASTVVASLTIWFALRRQARQPARELLTGTGPNQLAARPGRWSKWLAVLAALSAIGLVAWALASKQTANAGAFFGAGALVLVAGLGAAAAWMGMLGRSAAHSTELTLTRLGVRGCARRARRSLTTIALLASGCFVIVAIGVFRLEAGRDAARPTSGTGGFALIGESAIPVVHHLNSASGREFFGLNPRDLAGVNVVPMRVRAGDEASCLNLSRAQKPRLLGVQPGALQGRFTFVKVAAGLSRQSGSALLRANPNQPAQSGTSRGVPGSGPAEIPAIGDANSIQWALGKKIGDTIEYVDENGAPFKVRLVGAVANSILQGNLLIDEAEFTKRFPSQSGYRMFLLDVPSNSVSQVSATLSRALQDVGLELTPAVDRLNAFNAVQNTYLGTFQVLGGLGLLLGSAGLGIVVLRNVLERRGELALLLAVGFRRRALHKLVLGEHSALLFVGLALGVVAAMIAVLPTLILPATELPYASLAVTLGAVMLNGVIWTWLATRVALRGNLLAALRNE